MTAILKKYCEVFIQNLKPILISLAMAVIIWFTISFQIFPEIEQRIPNIHVDVTPTASMIDGNLEISPPFEDTVIIKVKGKRYDIGNLKADMFKVYMDLSMVDSPGEYTADMRVQFAKSGIDCEIDGGDKVQIRVIETMTKSLPLTADVSGIQVDGGMKIDVNNIIIRPDHVVISGEKSVISDIINAEVKVSYADVLLTSTELRGELLLYNSSNAKVENADISCDASSFMVSVPVIKVKTLTTEVSIYNYQSNFDLDAFKSKIHLNPDTLTVSAPDNSIDNLAALNIAEIPLSDLKLTDIQDTRYLIIKIPDGYGNISGNKVASMVFDDADDYGSMVFEVSTENSNIINVPSGYKANFVTNKISVTVVGPSDFIKSMTPSDITATVNLAGIADITVGEKSVTASFRLYGTSVIAWVSGEYKVSINLSEEQ